MTREKASSVLDDYDVNFDGHTAEEIAEAFDVAFRALEQEPCEDAVSRKTIDQNIYDYAESNGLSYANLKNAILDAPSVTPTQKWIPVAERLPEDKQRILVTRKSGTIGYISWNTWWNEQTRYPIDKVIAWMPLPQPYKEGSKE